MLHYDGTPITARFITERDHARSSSALNVRPIVQEGQGGVMGLGMQIGYDDDDEDEDDDEKEG